MVWPKIPVSVTTITRADGLTSHCVHRCKVVRSAALLAVIMTPRSEGANNPVMWTWWCKCQPRIDLWFKKHYALETGLNTDISVSFKRKVKVYSYRFTYLMAQLSLSHMFCVHHHSYNESLVYNHIFLFLTTFAWLRAKSAVFIQRLFCAMLGLNDSICAKPTANHQNWPLYGNESSGQPRPSPLQKMYFCWFWLRCIK